MYIVSLEFKKKCPSTVSPKEHLEPFYAHLMKELSSESVLDLLELLEKHFGPIEMPFLAFTLRSSTKP